MMKKFWNLMLAALVTMCAVACNDVNVEVTNPEQTGLSFEATIDIEQTRTDVVFNEGTEKWDTVWTGDETLNVRVGYTNYQFTNSVEDKNHFVCATATADALVGKSVTISLAHDANGNTLDSKAGKSGGKIGATISSFNPADGVNLRVQSAFLRYSSAYEVTLDASSNIFDYNGNTRNTITLPAGEDVWVAILPGSDVTLSYSIEGAKCKEKVLTFEAKKIYNLGELAPMVETVPVYLVPNNDWKNDGAWFAAHMWGDNDNNADVKMTDEDSDGVYECEVPANMTGIIFCRMNPAYTEFAWNSETEADHVWNQTEDLAIGVSPNNYYYITGWTTGEWNAEGYTPEPPVVEAIVWSLSGSFNNWGDTLMTATESANLFVAKGVELKSGNEIKVKDSKAWETNYGGGISNLEANKWMKAYFNGSNVVVAKSGTYDVYFEYAEGAEYSKLYLVEAEGDYTATTEQTANGVLVPDEPEQPEEVTPDQSSAWSLSGTFNNWGDTAMVTTTVKDVFVTKSLTLDAYSSFKVRKNKAWDENYGSGGIVYFNPNNWMTVSSNGPDISNTEAGTFDIYFDYTNKRLYMVTAGVDYTTVAQQTVEGKEPVQEEPEVTEKVLYLKPNANWKIDNARFAAYFFGGTPGEKWVSMTDSDKDGIYELYIPTGYDYGCNIIFCRMNPSTSTNNWNNKWNQTSDLKTPTDGKNLYTVKEDTWDKGGGSWSVK